MKIKTWIEVKDNGPSRAASLIPWAQVDGAEFMFNGLFRGRSMPNLAGMLAKVKRYNQGFERFAALVEAGNSGVLLPSDGWAKVD